MKYFFLTVIITLLAFNSHSDKKEGKKISTELYEKQKNIALNKCTPKVLNENRKEIKLKNLLDMPLGSDTIFILEAYDLDVESDSLYTYSTLWNSQGNEFSYERINNEKVKKTNKVYFSNYIKNLISTWDTIQIRNDEKKYNQISGFDIYATRITFFEGQSTVECISFRNFFNFEKEMLFE